jgi:hypothetical protein
MRNGKCKLYNTILWTCGLGPTNTDMRKGKEVASKLVYGKSIEKGCFVDRISKRCILKNVGLWTCRSANLQTRKKRLSYGKWLHIHFYEN